MKKIKDHFLIKNGHAFKSNVFIKSGIPLIKIKNISDNSIDLSLTNMDFLPESYVNDYSNFLVKKNDILIALSGATLGKFAFYENPQISLLNQRVALIRPLNNKTNIKYLYYYLFQVIDSIKNKEKGGAQANISTSDIENTDIFIPSIDIQNKIVSTLDKIQSLIDKRKRTIILLDEIIKSSFIDIFGDPVNNPKSLKTETLGNLGVWKTGGTPPRNNSKYFEGEIPWYSSGELNELFISNSNENISEEALLKTSVKKIEKGSLLLGMYDTAALKSSITTIDASCNQAIAFAKLNEKKCNPIYVYHAVQLSKTFYLNQRIGVRQQNLNVSKIKQIKIPLPKIEKQNKFADNVSIIINNKIRFEKSLETLEIFFKSFIQVAFAKNSIKEKSELDKYLSDLYLQQELFGKIKTQDFQLKEEYDKAKEILFELLESRESIISQTCENVEKIQIQIS